MISWDKRTFFLVFVILSIVVAVFAPSLKNDFIDYDDGVHLTDNPTVRSLDLEHIKEIFTTTVNRAYIPLTILSFAVERHFFGYDPFVYHLDNLLLHLALTALIFVFVLQLGADRRAAAVAALVFGVHPMHVESVVWVTERKDVLYGFFYMLALLGYGRYLRTRTLGDYARVFFLGLLSILAKPMALSLPLALLLCDWFHGRQDMKAALMEKIPIAACVASIAAVTYALNMNVMTVDHDPVKAVLIFIWTLTAYIYKFVCPFFLMPSYNIPEPVSFGNAQIVLGVVILALLAWCVWRHRKDRWVIFAVGYYLVSIFPVLRWTDMIPTAVADRYMYMPSVGFCILLGVGWDRLYQRFPRHGVFFRRTAYLCLAAVILALCFKSYAQSRIWKDSLAFWKNIVSYEPGSISYNGRGAAYLAKGEYNLAMMDFQSALALDPELPMALCNRGEVYKNSGYYDLALADFNKALIGKPGLAESFYAKVYHSRGLLYKRMGQYDLAMADFNKALEIDPNFWKSYNYRGFIELKKGQYDLALADFNKALAIDPDLIDALKNRGALYRIKKQYDLALVDFNKALVVPSANAYVNRGIIYGLKGRHDLAIADYDRALALDPNIGMVYVYKGIAEINQKRYKEAVADLTKAIALEPDNRLAYENRLKSYGYLREDAAAVKDLNQLLRIDPKNARFYYNRSVCFRNLGRNEEAYKDAQKAVALGYAVDPRYMNSFK